MESPRPWRIYDDSYGTDYFVLFKVIWKQRDPAESDAVTFNGRINIIFCIYAENGLYRKPVSYTHLTLPTIYSV